MIGICVVPESVEDFCGRRGDARLRLALGASLITHNGFHNVTLENLSQTGANVSGLRDLKYTACVLQWLGYEAFGEVVWVQNGLAGIKLSRQLSEEDVLNTRDRAPNVRQDLLVRSSARRHRL